MPLDLDHLGTLHTLQPEHNHRDPCALGQSMETEVGGLLAS